MCHFLLKKKRRYNYYNKEQAKIGIYLVGIVKDYAFECITSKIFGTLHSAE